MKKVLTGLSALALAGAMTLGTPNEAKADGGVLIGVGAYLLVDAIVGKKCDRREWPFNIVRKIGDELHGRPGCYHRRGYYHSRHHAWR